jgi:hypothetical protein
MRAISSRGFAPTPALGSDLPRQTHWRLSGWAEQLGGPRSGHATGMGYFQLCLFKRLLTYLRPPKYPAAAMAASRTITTKIIRDAGRELCIAIGAAIITIIEEYISNGKHAPEQRARWGVPLRTALASIAAKPGPSVASSRLWQ